DFGLGSEVAQDDLAALVHGLVDLHAVVQARVRGHAQSPVAQADSAVVKGGGAGAAKVEVGVQGAAQNAQGALGRTARLVVEPVMAGREVELERLGQIEGQVRVEQQGAALAGAGRRLGPAHLGGDAVAAGVGGLEV